MTPKTTKSAGNPANRAQTERGSPGTGAPHLGRKAIALGLCKAASGDTGAARELREITEDRIPQIMNLEGAIDYNAGKSAKEMLIQMLCQDDRE